MATAAPGLRRKTVEEALAGTEEEGSRLKRDLGRLDVTVIGIGVLIGAGIFVLTGQAAAEEAGPAITLSFVLAAVVSAFAALCYAEFAAMVPVSGSAYTFSYVTLGEILAFAVGWDLILELTVGAATVAVGTGGYLNAVLGGITGITLPDAISSPPGEGGIVNVPAIFVAVLLTAVLVRGIRPTARVNGVIVAITIAVLLLVVVAGGTAVDTANWSPYFPFGAIGVLGGAATVFFAYIGFDIVATTAEEARDPQRDMPWGIIGSLAVVTVLYVAVAAVITGMVPFGDLAGETPVAEAFGAVDQPVVAIIVYAGALLALLKTTLILMLGQTRVAFAMARDRLLPPGLARTHPTWHTPYRLTLIVGAVVALLAGVVPIATLADLVNIGTLFAFALVAIAVLVLRRTEPDRKRPFRTPFVPVVPVLAIVMSVVLMLQLEPANWLRFGAWAAVGAVVYLAYSRRRSTVGRRAEAG